MWSPGVPITSSVPKMANPAIPSDSIIAFSNMSSHIRIHSDLFIAFSF
jgi:hypothetical protein